MIVSSSCLHHEVPAVDADVPVIGSATVVILSQRLFVDRGFVRGDAVQHGTGLRDVAVMHDRHGVEGEVVAFLRPRQT